MMTVCVTGATGFIGRHLCEYFHRTGWSVRGLVRSPERSPFREPGIRLFKGRLPDELDSAAFEGADVLVHCAYATRPRSREEAYQVNELGTVRVYQMSRSAGVGRFVFLSSTGAHPAAESYYGRSKFRLEQLLDPRRDLIIRPGLVLGSGDEGLFGRMTALLRRTGVVPIFDGGRQIVQTIHLDDLCRAIDLAVRRGLTGTLAVAEPEGIELRRFFPLVAQRLGRRCVLIPLPMTPTLRLLRGLEALGLPCPLSSENLLGLKHMVRVPSADDLAAIGITVRSVEQSLALCFPAAETAG